MFNKIANAIARRNARKEEDNTIVAAFNAVKTAAIADLTIEDLKDLKERNDAMIRRIIERKEP